jgi:hypothetical protein
MVNPRHLDRLPHGGIASRQPITATDAKATRDGRSHRPRHTPCVGLGKKVSAAIPLQS